MKKMPDLSFLLWSGIVLIMSAYTEACLRCIRLISQIQNIVDIVLVTQEILLNQLPSVFRCHLG